MAKQLFQGWRAGYVRLYTMWPALVALAYLPLSALYCWAFQVEIEKGERERRRGGFRREEDEY